VTSPRELFFDYPKDPSSNRGVQFWLKPSNFFAARTAARLDNSNRWRYAFHRGTPVDQARSTPFSALLKGRPVSRPRLDGAIFRFIIIADTGEGDRSQYALLPAINALDPDFMIINGDVAYPAGRIEDYKYGFFEPYAGLDIPIWAVPGNHEYYSPGNGEEFFEIFCTRRREDLWQSHGIRLVPQPATYWALKEPGQPLNVGAGPMALPLTVIGVDTGHSGNLDGAKGISLGPLRIPPNPRRRFDAEDSEQYSWLDTRLREADAANQTAIVLFHIPSLVDTEKKREVHLEGLHQILSNHPSVRLVVCGHIHNYQRYAPDVFRQFLATEYRRRPNSNPYYVVAGAGGAALSATDFKPGKYPAEFIFPSAADWDKHAGKARKTLAKVGLGRSAIDNLAAMIDRSAPLDDDPVEFGCLLTIDVYPDRAQVTPVLIRDLGQLYMGRPNHSVISLNDKSSKLSPTELAQCFREDRAGSLVLKF
jgi:3',5'-cyclic AMP phosphodiesterase CpdA